MNTSNYGDNIEKINSEELKELGRIKGFLLSQYWPNGILNEEQMSVLHDISENTDEEKGIDVDFAEDILNLSDELQLSEEEIAQLKTIATGKVINGVLSNTKKTVQDLVEKVY